jgi:transaldolase
MNKGYFHRVAAQTPTKFWVNNPTRRETDLAIEAGAVGCTTNPAHCGKMIDKPEERELILKLLDQAIQESDSDSEAEAILQRRVVKTIQEKFLPVYERTGGRYGHVSIQGDPIREHDPQVIIDQGRANRALGPNIAIKIPTTAAGLEAMQVLVAEGTTINATEVFGVSQVISICEMYDQVTRKAGKYPRFYMSHIAGIYDEYLQQYVQHNNVDISPDVLFQAGLAVARKVYALVQERGYKCTFVGGGARGLHHFTEMVGADVCVTINWQGTADKLLEADPPVVYRVFNPVPYKVIDELMEKLPDFRRGYLSDGLSVEEYAEFGPVEHFRSSFIKNWKKVLDVVQERRAAK